MHRSRTLRLRALAKARQAAAKRTAKVEASLRAVTSLRQRRMLQRELLRRRAVQQQISREMRALRSAKLSPRRAEQTLVDWINGMPDARSGARASLADPVGNTGAKLAAAPGESAWRAVLALRDAAPNGILTDLEPLRAARTVSDGVLEDLLYSAYWANRRLPGRSQTVGVLLPARLETRFDRKSAGWQLRLRIIPDGLWVDSHAPDPTREEVEAITRFFAAQPDDDMAEEAARAQERGAWDTLLQQVTRPARAAYLVRVLAAEEADANGRPVLRDGLNLRESPASGQLRDLPGQLHIFAELDGGETRLLGRTEVDHTQLDIDSLDVSEEGAPSWLWDFGVAQQVGLGATLDLDDLDPAKIAALYITGQGSASPDGLFAAHGAAGRLGIVNTGSATNSVHGAPAADLGQGVDGWREAAAGGNGAAQDWDAVGQVLMGDETAFDHLPGGRFGHGVMAGHLVRALWPALWGHALRNLARSGAKAPALGVWARDWLAPEGPLPALRLDDDPYGLLPVTDLGGWRAGSEDPEIEGTIVGALRTVLPVFAALAAQAGPDGPATVVDADAEGLLDILARQPAPASFDMRFMLPGEAFRGALSSSGVSAQEIDARLEEEWDRARDAAAPLHMEMHRKYFAFGAPRPMDLPLVVPDNYPPEVWPQMLLRIEAAFVNSLLFGRPLDPAFAEFGNTPLVADGKVPFTETTPANSLLIRLAEISRILAQAEIGKLVADGDDSSPLRTKIARPERDMDILRYASAVVENGALDPFEGHPIVEQQQDQSDALVALGTLSPANAPALERALRATLDCAMGRVDTWATGLAQRRLAALDDAPRRLGLYAWVDRPFRGTPGAIPKTLLPVPSHKQLPAAVLLRDRMLHDPEPERWQMDLSSAPVREAMALAEEVRLGAYFDEALGRRVEDILGTSALIDAARKRFARAPGHQGRRVCNGSEALEALRQRPAGLSRGQVAALADLAQAVEAYGDMHLLSAATYLAEGRAEKAAEALDAMSGKSDPPEFEALKTETGGRSVRSELCIGLPLVPRSARNLGPGEAPIRIAEPSLTQWIDSTFGPADGPDWTWVVEADTPGDPARRVVDELAPAEAAPRQRSTVPLSKIAVSVADIAMLATQSVEDMVRDFAGGGRILPGESPGRARHEQLRVVLRAMAGEPFLPEGEGTADPGAVTVALKDLSRRLGLALKAANDLVTEIQTQTAAPTELQLALRLWGIEGGNDPAALAHGAAEMLTRIAQAAPAFTPDDPTGPGGDKIAKALAELVSADGHLPIFLAVETIKLPPLTTEEVPDELGMAAFDMDWLSTVAAVRPAAARMEACQLDLLMERGAVPFAPSTNKPKDPWQTDVALDPDTGEGPPTGLTVLYAPPGPLPKAMAVLTLDTWTEIVPETAHDATAGFGFNAPSMRAPHAILLAVPADLEVAQSPETLLASVQAARQVARARMVRPEQRDAFASVLPSLVLPDEGAIGFDATAYPVPERP